MTTHTPSVNQPIRFAQLRRIPKQGKIHYFFVKRFQCKTISWIRLLTLMIVIAAVTGTMEGTAAPVNDNCSNAASYGGQVSFDTTNATTDGPANCDISADVWYEFTAPGGGLLARTQLSTFDTEIAIYRKNTDCSDITSITCDNSDIPESLVYFQTIAGQKYLVRLGNSDGATGTGRVDIIFVDCDTYCPQAFPVENLNHADTLQEYSNRLAIGKLNVSGTSGCTAWLISEPDIVFTARHCITTDGSHDGASFLGLDQLSVTFDFECVGGSLNSSETMRITEIIHDNIGQDYALLRLSSAPSNGTGSLSIITSPPATLANTYHIGHSGEGIKSYTIGEIQSYNSANAPSSVQFSNAGAGGDSGAPIFDQATHAVIAMRRQAQNLQDCQNSDGSGQGPAMKDIVTDVLNNLPAGYSLNVIPFVDFGISAQSKPESVDSISILISLSDVSSGDVTIPFTVSGTATVATEESANDYTISPNPLIISAGSGAGIVTITVNNDYDVEDDETIILTMETPINAVPGTNTVHITTIEDDDTAVPLGIALDDVMVDMGAGGSYTPEITGDDSGNVYVVWSDNRNNGTYDIYFNRSGDSGKNWPTSDIRLNTDPTGSYSSNNARISCNNNGHVYVVWSDNRHGKPDIYFNSSTDYGASWRGDIRLDSDAPGLEESKYPEISCDNGDYVYVTWYVDRSGGGNIYFNRSDDSGTSWKTTQSLDDYDASGSISLLPQISSDNGGHVYVTWYDYRNGSSDIYLNYSGNNGESWLGNTRLNTSAQGASSSHSPRITSNDIGDVYVVWADRRNGAPDIYLNRSSDHGKTWIQPPKSDIRVDTTETPGSKYSISPQISCDNKEHVYVTWYDDRSGNYDIFCNVSSDKGVNWKTSDILMNNTETTGASSASPQLASNDYGTVIVTWYDNRESAFNYDIYMNYSNDFGANWNNEIRVDHVSGTVSSYKPQIYCDSSHRAVIVWWDSREGLSNIYTNRVQPADLDDLQSLIVTPVNASVVIGGSEDLFARAETYQGLNVELTRYVSWATSNESIVDIDDFGTATGIGQGNADLTAGINGLTSNPATITVVPSIGQTTETVTVGNTASSWTTSSRTALSSAIRVDETVQLQGFKQYMNVPSTAPMRAVILEWTGTGKPNGTTSWTVVHNQDVGSGSGQGFHSSGSLTNVTLNAGTWYWCAIYIPTGYSRTWYRSNNSESTQFDWGLAEHSYIRDNKNSPTGTLEYINSNDSRLMHMQYTVSY